MIARSKQKYHNSNGLIWLDFRVIHGKCIYDIVKNAFLSVVGRPVLTFYTTQHS